MALAQKHWALITDACGLTVAAAFGLGVLVQHMTTAATVTVAFTAALVGTAVLVVALAIHGSMHIAAAITAWTALAVSWILFAHIHRHVWALSTWRWLVLPAIALTAWSAMAGHYHITRLNRMVVRDDTGELRQIEDMLANLGLDGIQATKQWRTDRGRAITLILPANGRVILRSLQAVSDGVAAALRLPAAAVVFQGGKHAGEAVLRLDDNNAMARDLPYAEDDRPLTITKPFPIGVMPSGKHAPFNGQFHTLFTGVNGSGKTNTLNVVIAQYMRCPDCIVFVIDLKGGRLAAPWIRPWVEGRCVRPAIDWVATTRDEAWLMLSAMDDLVTLRGSSLAGGVAKFHPSHHEPWYVVIVDEMADVTGDLPRKDWNGISPNDMAELGAKLTRKARSEGVSMDWATQKGTVDFTGSSAIKSQCKQRVSLATASESDARSITDSNAVVRLLASAPYVGSAAIESPTVRDPVLSKVWRLDGDDDADTIDRLAVAAGNTRPKPDALALRAFGDRYTERWDRSAQYQLLLEAHHARTGLAPLPAPPGAPPVEPTVAAVAQIDVNQEAARLFGSIGLGATADPVARMWSLLADHPNLGLTVIEILRTLEREGLSVHRSTLYRHLKKAKQDGTVRASGDNDDGDAARWILV